MKKRNLRRRTFTLIELMVVIVILMMLAAGATPLVLNNLKKARIGTAKSQIRMLEQALDDYKLDVGSYPEGEDGLQALLENINDAENWDGPYIKPAVPKDPWGHEYVYVCPGDHGEYDLYSCGKDGSEGGEGEDADVVSWE